MSTRMKLITVVSAVLSLSIFGCADQNPRVATKINLEGSLVGDFPWNPLQGKVITSWIDKQNSTMSTLYGNDPAVQYARSNPQHNYPSGSVLSLVTWNQKEDDRWFGAKIPAAPRSVEFVTVGSTEDHRPWISYQQFEGAPLKKISAQDGPVPNDRAAYLLSQRAAVMP
jgi:hypothetical protein